MTSGGARARSGPGADPNSYRSQKKDWVSLPAGGFAGDIPAFPLPAALKVELELWAELWRKPQAVMWDQMGMKFQVAAYARAFLESVEEKASAGLKTAVLRMEGELGLSVPGMHSLGWRIDGVEVPHPVEGVAAARQTSSGDWLKAVTVEGA